MRRADIRNLIRSPLFTAGVALQCLSAALTAVVLLAIRLGWIDIIRIGLETPLDERSPKLDALYWGLRCLVLAFASGFVFYALAFHRLRNAQQTRCSEPGDGAPVGSRGSAAPGH